MNMDDPNSLTMDKLWESLNLLELIPQYEVQLGPGQTSAFGAAWNNATMPFGRPAPDPMDFKSTMFQRVPLGGIPVVTSKYMPPGVGTLIQKRRGGGADIIFILYFADGELKVMKLDPPEQLPHFDFSLMPKVVT